MFLGDVVPFRVEWGFEGEERKMRRLGAEVMSEGGGMDACFNLLNELEIAGGVGGRI